MRSRLVILTALAALLVVVSAHADDEDPFGAPAPLPDLPDLPRLPELPPLDSSAPAPAPAPSPAPSPAPTPAPTPEPAHASATIHEVSLVSVAAAPDAVLGQYDEYRRALSAYSIDSSPVSAADYQRCVASGKCTAPSCTSATTDPVTCVDQSQAQAYCASVGSRLPTEDEWEPAAREAIHLGIHGTTDHHAEWTASPYCCFCNRDDQIIRGGPM